MVFGCFDIIHPGHLYFLKKAKSLGDKLIVVVARDSTIRKVKKKEPMYNEKERLEHLRELKCVNKAILGDKEDKYKVIEEFKPDIICLGYDQKIFVNKLKDELKKRNIKADIIRIGPYKEHIYKSSKLYSSSPKSSNSSSSNNI